MPLYPQSAGTLTCAYGETLTAGDPVYLYDDSGTPTVKKVTTPFRAKLELLTACYEVKACKVDTDTVVVVYTDGATKVPYACVIDTSDPDSLTEGSSTQVDTGVAYFLTVRRVATGKFMVVYRNASGYGTAAVGTVSAGTVTMGTPSTFATGDTHYPNACRISDTQMAVTWQGASEHGMARVCSISGTTPTWGTETTFESGAIAGSGCVWSSGPTYVLIFYVGDGDDLYSIYSPISGNNFSGFTGKTLQQSGSGSTLTDVAEATSGKYVVSWRDGSYSKASLLTKVGYLVEHKETIQASPGLSYYQQCEIVTSNQMLYAYSDEAGNAAQLRTSYLPSVDFDDITSPVRFSDVKIRDLDVSKDDETSAWRGLLVWTEYDGYTAYAQCLDSTPNSFGDCIGVAEHAGASGSVGQVTLLGGRTGALTGHDAGTVLYIQSDASIGEAVTDNQIGVALGDADVLLGKILIEE